MKDIEGIFVKHGGEFVLTPFEIQEKLKSIKAFIFDWDGVFNSGRKGKYSTSDFTEGDAMGINMLRFSFYLKVGFNPLMFIATGAQNPTAIEFTKRENFNAVFFSVLKKADVLPVLKQTFDLEPDQCAFIFDDILDLSLAQRCGLRFYVRKHSNPILNRYILNHRLCEYMTGNDGSSNAIREICELIISLHENYDDAIGNRAGFSPVYDAFNKSRKSIEPVFLIKQGDNITEFQPEQ